ncbi:helix-turn-helix domain-containing protein [Paenibacillus thermoaerophilus]|uniref:DNA topoisomerase (ATP-hydrolyzing) n=1 Tax=Paenibacillus thermoaerophilus TaxID=1215385 RepID=A0ABW2UZL6_9BACL|nr:ATP-binding protein [Paenibacillus thermoaerophilus]
MTTSSRDYGAELDALRLQVEELRAMIQQLVGDKPLVSPPPAVRGPLEPSEREDELGVIYYSGQYSGVSGHYRWEPQEKHAGELLDADGDKVAKVLAALGHKQRLDILRAVIREPLTGPELVERLGMGTTGQLYHHLKALLGADLLHQEERGGSYSIPGHRTLPLLLLLAAASELLDASDYLDLSEVRNHPEAYLGSARTAYDPHLLLWAIVENSILEHQAGSCSEVDIFLHDDGSITVADNGRGIPVQALSGSDTPRVQAVLTNMNRLTPGASYVAPGAEKGISIAVVNALSIKLCVEIRRDGRVFRQEYKHGIPQTGLLTVGLTQETGTSVTITPDPELFDSRIDRSVLAERVAELATAYPELTIRIQG